jgi:hypothetical protein
LADALERARNPQRSDRAARRATAQLDAATLHLLGQLYGGGAEADARRDLRARQLTNHYVAYYHYAAPFERSVLQEAWAQCTAPACATGLRSAEAEVGPLDVDLPTRANQPETPEQAK